MSLKFDKINEGFRVYRGPHLVGIVTTNQHCTDPKKMSGEAAIEHTKGVVQWEPMPKESWTVHLTSPSLSVDELKELAAGIPA